MENTTNAALRIIANENPAYIANLFGKRVTEENVIAYLDEQITFDEPLTEYDNEKVALITNMIAPEFSKMVSENEVFNMKITNFNDTIMFEVELKGVVSKQNFKALAELNYKIGYSSKMDTSCIRIDVELADAFMKIITKSSKWKQETLKTVLKCRLEGLYSLKNSNGKTWNQGGIDKA